MGGPVTWFEISTKQAKAVRDFYAKVFDWKFNVLDGQGYALVDTQSKKGIQGGIGDARGPNQVVFYIEVEDPKATLARIEKAGGKTVVPVTETEMVTFAQFADPQGNVIGIFKATS